MSMQPWNILTAPEVEWKLPQGDDDWISFNHVNTRVTLMSSDGCASGFTLWSADVNGNTAFMAFDWVELKPGVPILTDPNAVLTNLCIVDNSGEQESKLRKVAHVNVMIYQTRWQEAAAGAANAYREQDKAMSVGRGKVLWRDRWAESKADHAAVTRRAA